MFAGSKSFFLPGSVALVLGLGVNCTIGYGTLFYSFSLLSVEFEQHFGWSQQFIFGIFSIGIFCSGLLAPVIGRYLDRYGVRHLMSGGSLIVAATLCALSFVNNKVGFTVALIFLEVVSILVLYESAFVALTRFTGERVRYPITQITLMAGFASTIFWPLISWLLTWTDWRAVYLVMAALHLFICLPIHWLVLKKDNVHSPAHTPKKTQLEEYRRNNSSSVKWLLAFALGASAFAINALQIHFFYIAEDLGIASALAVTVGVLVGPSQVFARVADMLFGHKISPMLLGIISFGLMLVGVIGLLVSNAVPMFVWIFAIAFGAGQGLSYIVRGAVPVYLFGHSHYGAITGQLNGVRMMLTAISPFSFSLLMQGLGVKIALLFLLFLMLLSILILCMINKPKATLTNTLDTAQINQ